MIRRVASIPSMPGIIKSIMTRSGRSVAVNSTASAPVDAWPMTRISGSEFSSADNTSRVTAESSTMSTRTEGATFAARACMSDMHILLRRTPYEAPNGVEQLTLIEFALQHVRVCADLEAAAAIIDGVARRDDEHRDVTELLVGADALGQLEAGHARHIDVGDDEIPFLPVQALERFEAVAPNFGLVSRSKPDVLLQLARHERVIYHQDAAY